MKESVYRLSAMILIIVFLAVFGTVFFMGFEGYAVYDALALTISTLSTVGWADTANLSTPSKILCTILSLGAIGLVVGFIATFSQLFLAGTIQEFLGRRKMDDRIRQLKGQYIVCGFGLTGRQIATDLAYEHKSFLVIDTNPLAVQIARELGYLYIEGNATDEEILKKAEIAKAEGLFSVLDSDADNLLVVLSARGLNEELKIVSRVTSDEMRERFFRAGADNVVSYIDWASRNMISAMLKPKTLQLLTQFLDASISETHLEEVEIPETSHLVGKSLQESGIREETGVHVMGYFCCEKAKVLSNPPPGTIFKGGDIIVGLGTRDGFKKLENYARQER
jgi:voltage-gated potassium channel